MTTLSYRFACRRKTAAAWQADNDVLLNSEIGVVTDSGNPRAFKIGDGATAWNSLPVRSAQFATASGTNTVTATFTPKPVLYDGMVLQVRAAGANTGAATFNPNALGALAIKKKGGTALVAGDIAAAGHELILRYVAGSPGHYELLNPATAGLTASATDIVLGRSSVGPGAIEEIPCTAFARTLLDDIDAPTARATLGVTPGNSIFSLVKKTANQNRSSTTTLADDSQLTIPLTAATGYTIRGRIFYQVANATMDFKLAPAYSGTTTTILYHRSIFGAGASAAAEIANTTASFATFTPDSPAAGVGCMSFDLYLLTNSSGTFSIQWAQNVSDAGNATLLAGSYLEYAAF